MAEFTYAFEDGQVFAYNDGRVLAAGSDVDKVKDEAERELRDEEAKKAEEKAEKAKASATHIVTPNGVKGKIVSRHSSWDADQTVSVRFDNGRIVPIAVSKLPVESFITEQAKTASGDTPITQLHGRLNSDFGHDKESLTTRQSELQAIGAEASQLLVKGASFTDEQQLDEIVVLADAERSEIAEALEHLEQADAEIFAPYDPQVVEQAQVGTDGLGGTFLDQTVQDMITEAEGQDFEKILDEGPVKLVAELPDAAIADTGVTTSAARDFITAKTAGVQTNQVQLDKYQGVFLERVEAARRKELVERNKTSRHEASVEEPAVTEGPDESLFL